MFLTFDHPWYLALLLVVPAVWLLGFRGLSGLGRLRRVVVLGLRSAVLVIFVLALAQAQWVRTSNRLTVVYLLDQSLSIPEEQRRMMAEFVNQSVAKHRLSERQDRAAVIVFAKQAAVEQPPIDDSIHLSAKVESPLDTTHTNLAGALKLALATLPADSASRVVVVSDGNENYGNALEEARLLAEQGVGIDVVPVRYAARSEVAVAKVAVPSDVRAGQPFDLRVVVDNTAPPAVESGSVKGTLQIYRKSRDREEQIASQPVELAPGKRVFSMREQIDSADSFTYTARFVPDDEAADHLRQNNEASGFTQVRGQGQVLLIEDSTSPGDFDFLVEHLRREQLHVTVVNSDEMFTSLGQLQPFDTVVLANVPREAISRQQIEMLVANTQQLGAGLIVLGGPNSFGAGGWADSKLEEALPVYCQVKNPAIRPVGALGLVIDRSGSMTGEKIEMAVRAARASVDMVGDRDYITVSAFDSSGYLIVPLVKKGESQSIHSRINRISADGGTNMEPALRIAAAQLGKASEAAVKHMVVLTDGHTEGSNYPPLIESIRRGGITLSAVAVGGDADLQLLDKLARAGGGRFYHAKTARILPRIFQTEARVVSRPLVYEKKSGMQPQIKFQHEILKGIDAPPPVTGYVLTTRKESPLVEVALVSPLPAEEENRTLLATWTYGLGKVVAFTSDVGQRWAANWPNWPNYDKLFSQMVRWSMRPSGDQGNFSVATEVRDEKVQVVVNALDKNDEFLNFLAPMGSAVGPDMKPRDLRLKQTAPGRYVGEFAAQDAGNYFLMIAAAPGSAPNMTAVNVPYSSEFLDRDSNDGLLTALAEMTPADSQPGMLIEASGASPVASLAAVDVFRHNLRKASSRQDVWPQLMLLASCLFFCDVFVRRVHVDLTPLPGLLVRARDRLLRRDAPTAVQTIARLRSRKAALVESLESQRASVRFEPTTENDPLGSMASNSPVADASPVANDPVAQSVTALEAESFTSRLLKAKRQALENRPD
ncbi:MAG: VWA domain-containing protein [Pirellulales bacterium]|nr:VWA domain-containing protein [Pirellulales bacterium]